MVRGYPPDEFPFVSQNKTGAWIIFLIPAEREKTYYAFSLLCKNHFRAKTWEDLDQMENRYIPRQIRQDLGFYPEPKSGTTSTYI